MSQLVEEVKIWNTPLIGAYLLWRFSLGYSKSHPNGDAPIVLLHFVAIGILTSAEMIAPISNRRDDLQSYVRHFEIEKKVDLLISLQSKISVKKKYTLDSLDVASTTGLLSWDSTTAKIYPADLEKKPGRGKKLRDNIKRDGDKAEILGTWFAKHDLQTILKYLKVVA